MQRHFKLFKLDNTFELFVLALHAYEKVWHKHKPFFNLVVNMHGCSWLLIAVAFLLTSFIYVLVKALELDTLCALLKEGTII